METTNGSFSQDGLDNPESLTMKVKSMSCLQRLRSKTRSTDGLTLIEVIASVGLLATLLVMTVSIRANHVRQINQSHEIEEAVAAIDYQMAIWFEDSASIPLNQTGSFDGSETIYWKTTQLESTSTNPNWNPVSIRIEAISVVNQSAVAFVDILDAPVSQETRGAR